MTVERVIEIMEEEYKRTNTGEVLEAYRFVINALKVARELEEKEKYREDIMSLADKWQFGDRLEKAGGINYLVNWGTGKLS